MPPHRCSRAVSSWSAAACGPAATRRGNDGAIDRIARAKKVLSTAGRKILTVRYFLTIGVHPMITSKITSKAQTTIPQPVREALRVREGDELAYTIEHDRVILTKAARAPKDDPFAT